MVRYYHQLSEHEFEQMPGDGGGQRSLARCSPWSHKELDITYRLNNIERALKGEMSAVFTPNHNSQTAADLEQRGSHLIPSTAIYKWIDR